MSHPIPEHQCPQCGYSTVVTINSDGTKVPSRIAALAAELREAKKECDEYRLDDSILRKAYEESGMGQRFTWHGWLLQLVRENATLRATVARLTVACEYVLNTPNVECLHVAPKDLSCARCKIDDALIASRAKEPQ